MFPQTQNLLQRLSRQFPDAREWFDAVRQWYKDAKLSAGVIAQLLRGENLELLRLSLNGETKPADVEREADGRRILLNIPSARLWVGENTFTLGLTDDAEQPLELEAVHLGQSRTQLRQKIDLDTVRPTPAPTFQLTGCDRAEPRAGCWELRANGHLAFRFYLHTLSRVTVALDLPDGARFPRSKARLAKQKKLLKEVGKRVEEKLKKWIDETAKKNDPQSRTLTDDLRAYGELYAKQIRPAVEGEGSLQSSIDRTGNPDKIVSANAQPVPLQPAVVTLVADPVVAPVKARRVKPPAPPRKARLAEPSPRRPDPQPRPRSAPVKSGGFLGKLFVTLFLAALSAGVYAAWKNDGLGWLSRQVGLAETPSKSRGEVLIALRDASTDIGWKPEVCQDLIDGQGDGFVGKSGQQFFGLGGSSERSYVYVAGDRKNAKLEAENGFPSSDVMLVVIEFDDAATAKKHFDALPQQFAAGLQGMGLKGENTPVTIPHCDSAFNQRSEFPAADRQQNIAQFGSDHKVEVIARSGRFVVQMFSTRFIDRDEQIRMLTPLVKRLNDHFPR